MRHENGKDISVEEAIRTLKRRLENCKSRKTGQLNEETKHRLTAAKLALLNQCGKCIYVRRRLIKEKWGSSVELRCRKGHSPADLYFPKAVDICSPDPVCEDFSA